MPDGLPFLSPSIGALGGPLPMKILVVADLHYALPQFDWLVARAASADLVIIAGDLLDLAGFADLDTQIVVVKKYLSRIRERAPLVVCSGNHDGDERNAAGEHVARWLTRLRMENVTVDYQSIEIGGVLVSVFPWWDGEVTQREMRAFLESERARARRPWLWVYHAPPLNSPVAWTGSKDAGDAVLRELIEAHQPDYVVSGHIHNSPFFPDGSWVDRLGSTWVFNPGHQMGALPPSIVIDLGTQIANWTSSYGEGSVNLASDLPARAT